MPNVVHLDILMQGVETWNRWREDHPGIQAPDLRQATLSGMDLRGANFYLTNLRGANLKQSDLAQADLDQANLCEASLEGARLCEANIIGANFHGASLQQADFSESSMGSTDLTSVDLSTVKGLQTVSHWYPSSIGVDTIYLSGGDIPDGFLRKVGVPEPFIVHMKSLVGAMEPVQFYSCFISYSNRDHEFATRLHADLQSKGVRCWFAPEDLKIGQRLRPSFDEAIRLHDKLMVILSESSVKSQWVEKEVETAFEKERQQNRTALFPIRLDAAVMETQEAWAADIRRTRHIGDFREWKDHDSYIKAFDRLLRDLRAEDKAASTAKSGT